MTKYAVRCRDGQTGPIFLTRWAAEQAAEVAEFADCGPHEVVEVES